MTKRLFSEAGASIASLLVQGSRVLEKAGIESPSNEAQAVMAALLGVNRAGVIQRLRDELAEEDRRRYTAWIARREKREPLQYILGQVEFCGRMFAVNPATLIPRPETELLVSEGAAFIRETGGILIADIGTGSGCVAVSLAAEHPSAEFFAVDSSRPALETAAENARKHGVEGRVRLEEGDLFGPLEKEGLSGRLDLIVTNPPYVPTGDIPSLQPEVRFEPLSALSGGPDGLDVIRRIIRDAPAFLKPAGALMMEIGFGQAEAVHALVAAEPGLGFVRFVKDFAGIERVLVAKKM